MILASAFLLIASPTFGDFSLIFEGPEMNRSGFGSVDAVFHFSGDYYDLKEDDQLFARDVVSYEASARFWTFTPEDSSLGHVRIDIGPDGLPDYWVFSVVSEVDTYAGYPAAAYSSFAGTFASSLYGGLSSPGVYRTGGRYLDNVAPIDGGTWTVVVPEPSALSVLAAAMAAALIRRRTR